MPSRAENIIRIAGRVGMWGNILIFFVSRFWLQVCYGLHIMPPWPVVVFVSRSMWVIWAFCVLLWLVSSLVVWLLSRNRTALVRSAQVANLQEVVNPPSVTAAYRSTSLLSLTWSMDYRRSVLQNCKQVLLQPSTWLSNSLLGFYFAWAFPWAFAPFASSSEILSRCIAFLVGYAISIGLSLAVLAFRLTKNFPSHARVQHLALIVEPDGVRSVLGSKQIMYPWSTIGKVKNLAGLVLYKRHGVLCLIPDFAFQSRADTKAFVATLNALKMGLPPPPHDWSGYVPVEQPAVEGVWPPPIK